MTFEEVRQEIWKKWGQPSRRVIEKSKAELDEWAKQFILNARFLVVASADDKESIFTSPRGGEPGFIDVQGNSLVIPNRLGNNLFETITNILSKQLSCGGGCPVGLILLIPGVGELLRIQGDAFVGEFLDGEFRPLIEIDERRPESIFLKIDCKKWYYHCAKATKFAQLWDGDVVASVMATPPVARRP